MAEGTLEETPISPSLCPMPILPSQRSPRQPEPPTVSPLGHSEHLRKKTRVRPRDAPGYEEAYALIASSYAHLLCPTPKFLKHHRAQKYSSVSFTIQKVKIMYVVPFSNLPAHDPRGFSSQSRCWAVVAPWAVVALCLHQERKVKKPPETLKKISKARKE